MVVSLSPPGVRCQVGDFVMLIDLPDRIRQPAEKAGRLPKANLILKTEMESPPGFPLPPEVVTGAGEYEISGVRVKGIGLGNRTVYAAELESIRLAFLGELEEESVGEILDKLGEVDVLFLAAPASKTKQVMSLIKQVDPKIIVPLNDKTAKILAEELGQKVKAEEKLVIKRRDLDKEQVAHKLVWLKS